MCIRDRLYDPIWMGLGWRPRGEQEATFWDYPYRDQMRLGLNSQGKAVVLSPLGYPGPFPDGLNTLPCPPGSPPRCTMETPRVKREYHHCPGQDPNSQEIVAMCEGPAPEEQRKPAQ